MSRSTTSSRTAPNAIWSSRRMTVAQVDSVCAPLSSVPVSIPSRGTVADSPTPAAAGVGRCRAANQVTPKATPSSTSRPTRESRTRPDEQPAPAEQHVGPEAAAVRLERDVDDPEQHAEEHRIRRDGAERQRFDRGRRRRGGSRRPTPPARCRWRRPRRASRRAGPRVRCGRCGARAAIAPISIAIARVSRIAYAIRSAERPLQRLHARRHGPRSDQR